MVYNLAFSPKIRLIDASSTGAGNTSIVENFAKLLEISGSIQTLILSNTNFIQFVNEKFAMALGASKTIEYLNLDSSSPMKPANWPQIFFIMKAVAMNKMKNGALQHLSVKNFANLEGDGINKIFESFKISEFDHEMWYGEEKIAKEMKLQ